LKWFLSFLILKFIGKGLLLEIISFISFQSMCIGALAAILLFKENVFKHFNKILNNKLILVFVIVNILCQLFYFNQQFIISVFFAWLILIVVKQKIEIKFLKFFGKISYGIYMFHPTMIFLSFSLANNVKSQLLFNFLLYGFSFGLTILTSYFSYQYFERPILNWKSRYTIIKSGLD
jgi:peptidoglycan/LPS O-acetylase OafA/YrhL